MNITNNIISLIAQSAAKHQINTNIELDSNPVQGDYSSNIALRAFSKGNEAWNSPRQLAEKLVASMEKPDFVEKIEIAGPGFINFYIDPNSAEKFFSPEFSNSEKSAIIEYMQPNTNKPLHVGHLRNAILGKSLINLLKKVGWDIKAATINNDRGLHIIKSMWAYLMEGSTPIKGDWRQVLNTWESNPSDWPTLENNSLGINKGDFFVGHFYVLADKSADDDAVVKQWQEMLLSWENKTDPDHKAIRKLWKQMNAWFYDGATESYKLLDVSFDDGHVAYESEIYEAGKQLILDGVEKGIFKKLPDGAVLANLEGKFKLPNKILLRKDGTGIYMTFDIELTRQRSQSGTDLIIWVVGNDQELYFKQLFAVCELLGYGDKNKFHHFSYGMVRLPEGKMSSRKGTVIYADEVLGAAIEKAKEVMETSGVGKDLSTEEKEKISKEVGIGAVKFTMLSYDPKSEIAFDLEKSVTFEGDSGPYVQYAHARCQSVLNKVGNKAVDSVSTEEQWHPAESELARKLIKIGSVIERAASEYSPHFLTTYLLELAQDFGRFYNQCPILGNKRREMLTKQTKQTLALGLSILGISAPEKM